jgi:hypothetical protein
LEACPSSRLTLGMTANRCGRRKAQVLGAKMFIVEEV